MIQKEIIESTRLTNAVTVKKYGRMVADQDRQGLARFLQDRFHERYFEPLESVRKPHGFFTMAICSLLLEAIQAFRVGSEEEVTDKEKAYADFFADHPGFGVNREQGRQLYHTMRSGILHLGKTKGWRIRRQRTPPIFDFQTKVIQAALFYDELKRCFTRYCEALSQRPWNAKEWQNFLNRMKGVIKHCDPDYEPKSKHSRR
jgi:hypothetical protein